MSSVTNEDTSARSIQAGARLAHPAPEDEVVITGLSGRFPDSDSVYEFRDKLFNKVDLVSDDGRRWKLDHPEIPQRTGKVNDVSKFDASFFGVHYKQAHTMDPMCRMLLERAYEAVVDAGFNPRFLKGSRCGVFIGACFSESEKTWFYEKIQINGFGITGCSRAMLANRISYWLGVHGPSYSVDSACSSSSYALEHAYKAIRDGHCDMALVGSSNLCLHPYVSLQFFRLGVLSQDGACKSFDNGANGYCRSEAIPMIFLQKRKDARRIYATVVHCKTNCDGYKEQGITYPSGQMQYELLKEFYLECGINPATLNFVEAHGTGTKVGDPEECNALDKIFCKGRKEPLLIGSIKSNIGHAEPASGLCSIIKVIIAMETGFIPPNIHFQTPREGIPAFVEGRMKVVTEKQPWPGGLAGVNSFGFGGANCHVLLKWNEKKKVDGGAPKDGIPRLVVVSGRTEEAVKVILDDLESRPVDVEFIKLLHDIHSESIRGHIYRGFTVLTNTGREIRDIQYFSGEKNKIWFVFSGMGSQWAGMGKSLMKIPVFAAAIEKCHNVLAPKGVDLKKIITDEDPKTFDNILHSFIGIAAMQVGLVDILFALGIYPDNIIGHSVGELGCAYADGCFTAEQMILAAYYRGLASVETEFIKGSMYAVGLGYSKIKAILPPEIDVACHNGPESCTLSGPADAMKKFATDLTNKGIFAKEVPCSNIPFHSRYIAKAGPKLLHYLQKIIPHPKPRTSKWICSSAPKQEWDTPKAQFCSPEYHTNNLLSPVLFEESSKLIPNKALCIEIAPHGLLQAILKRSLTNVTNVALMQRKHADNIQVLLTGIGKLYEAGIEPQLASLYPPVSYPVSRGTPMISPLVRWEHSQDWYVTSYRLLEKIKSGERIVQITLRDEDMEFISGHVIDGRNLYPATGYLTLVWETIGLMRGEMYTQIPIVFENVRFNRATTLPKEGSVEFTIMIQKGSGTFEIVEGGAAIVQGRVYVPEDIEKEVTALPELPPVEDQNVMSLNSRDIYKELRLRGYHYKGLFRGLASIDNLGTHGSITWANNYVAFMDNMLQTQILQEDTRSLYVPTSIRRMVINATKHFNIIQDMADIEPKTIPVTVYKEMKIISSGGIEIHDLKASQIPRRKPLGDPVLERFRFMPHIVTHESQHDVRKKTSAAAYKKILSKAFKKPLPSVLKGWRTSGGRLDGTLQLCAETDYLSLSERDSPLSLLETLRLCFHLILENTQGIKVKVLELGETTVLPDSILLANHVASILGDLPLIQAEIVVLSGANNTKVKDFGPNITVEDKKLSAEQNCLAIIASNILNNKEQLEQIIRSLKEDGYLIVRENPNTVLDFESFHLLVERIVDGERIVLLQKKQITEKFVPSVLKISENDDFAWIPLLKKYMADISVKSIILVAEKEKTNGLLGLVNCLRKEPGGEIIRCVFIFDNNAPAFDPNLPFYAKQLEKQLAINVLKNGLWGTYRHEALPSGQTIPCEHIYMNAEVRGDLSSLKAFEGPLNINKAEEEVIIYYSALNFRDVMLASGKLSVDAVAKSRRQQEIVIGFEFSGRMSKSGRRVMGMVPAGALASKINAHDRILKWDVPDQWSLAEAATIPVVYGTVFSSLVISGRMKAGESVLIHSGTGGVGLAAITVALHYGCEIFTTVGTQEKREFLRKTFPQIPENHIGNSRDTSFEEMIKRETKGKGVDLILNSLAEEKLQASLRCLGQGGRFLEIGKFDMANNTPIGMEIFLKNVSFHGVHLDSIFTAPQEKLDDLYEIISNAVKSDVLKPLKLTVFDSSECEKAFRYMTTGKHIGKVLMKLRDEEEEKVLVPRPLLFQGIPRMFCSKSKSYVILGGLGGFGLELTDWLVMRGARKVVLTSRTGLKTGYQALRIRLWRSYGTEVVISTEDVTTESGVVNILKQANQLGPVDGIFNLAVVLRDALFENQTEENFGISFGPKAVATKHLDKVSRLLCPHLNYFVIFSSVSCGRGNAGQTNYGMANSIMERICEKRVEEGYPGLAIQWGAIGEVGLVAEMQEDHQELVIGGTLQQSISSCLKCMDLFLKQKNPVVASMVVAEKRALGSGSGNIVDTVANIIGIQDLKTVSLHSSLAELGMDSMMAVEIKQTLEREMEVYLTAQDIRSMTFAKLAELGASTEDKDSRETRQQVGEASDGNDLQGLRLILRLVGDEESSVKPFVSLPSLAMVDYTLAGLKSRQEDVPPLFLIPGMEGVASVMKDLASKLRYPVICLQFPYNDSSNCCIREIAERMHKVMKSEMDVTVPFLIVGYSTGALVALELVTILEEENLTGKLILIDGAPDFLREITKVAISEKDDEEFDSSLLHAIYNLFVGGTNANVKENLNKLKNWNDKLEHLLEIMPESVPHRKEHQKIIASDLRQRLKAVLRYERSTSKKLGIEATLLRPSEQVIPSVFPDDYNLSQIFVNPVGVHFIEGNHLTMLDNQMVADIINKSWDTERELNFERAEKYKTASPQQSTKTR